MSKSVGNIVDPFVLADKYSADALRYYLMSDIATGKDADFSEERLVERYNCRSGQFVRQFAQSNPRTWRIDIAMAQVNKAASKSLIDIRRRSLNLPMDATLKIIRIRYR